MQVGEKDQRHYQSRQPDKWEMENGYIGLVEGQLLKWKWSRKDGMDYNIQQQPKAKQIPDTYPAVRQAFTNISEVVNKRGAQTSEDIKIAASKGHYLWNIAKEKEPIKNDFYRDTHRM